MLKRNWGGSAAKLPDEDGCYRCSRCLAWKAPTEYKKNKAQKSGLSYMCRACSVISGRKLNLPAKYGISWEEFLELLAKQNSKCACCDKQFVMESSKSDRPHGDHNHKTGAIRGLLCNRCNIAAGHVQDSSIQARKLAAYLEAWAC